MTNQCDGCCRKIPVSDGFIHRDGQVFGMACTANRYKDSCAFCKHLNDCGAKRLENKFDYICERFERCT